MAGAPHLDKTENAVAVTRMVLAPLGPLNCELPFPLARRVSNILSRVLLASPHRGLPRGTKSLSLGLCANACGVAHREVADLDGVVGACDECDEETEHHVDEQADEGVQVELREEPDQAAAALLRLHGREGHEHVIPVDEREQALGHHGQ